MKKKTLRTDSVESNTIHIGIELELIGQGGGSEEHDDESCDSSYREMLESEGVEDVLRNHFSLTRDEARSISEYFNFDQWLDNYMQDRTCDDSECPHNGSSHESMRDSLKDSLVELTENRSIKVDSDGSIRTKNNEYDAEVCWNYYISKETVKDNAKILEALSDDGYKFNNSCGLHINLNNYLNVKALTIQTSQLDFLFNFVGPSRKSSTFCNAKGMSGDDKYSMIYNQTDRLEFRFFSPTLDAIKLNHYVTLAHTIYKRLAGVNAKLPRKTSDYLMNKMVTLNGIDPIVAEYSINAVNSLKSAERLVELQKTSVKEGEEV